MMHRNEIIFQEIIAIGSGQTLNQMRRTEKRILNIKSDFHIKSDSHKREKERILKLAPE